MRLGTASPSRPLPNDVVVDRWATPKERGSPLAEPDAGPGSGQADPR